MSAKVFTKFFTILAGLIFLVLIFRPHSAKALQCSDFLLLYLIECNENSCNEGFLVEDRITGLGSYCERLPHVTDISVDEIQQIANYSFSSKQTSIEPSIYQIQIWTQCGSLIRKDDFLFDDRCKNRIYVDLLQEGSLVDLQAQKENETQVKQISYNVSRLGIFLLILTLGLIFPTIVIWHISKSKSKWNWVWFGLILAFQAGFSFYLFDIAVSFDWILLVFFIMLIILCVIIESIYFILKSLFKNRNPEIRII